MCVGKKRSYTCVSPIGVWGTKVVGTTTDFDIKRPTLVTKGLGIDWTSHLSRLIRVQIVCECNPGSTDVTVK